MATLHAISADEEQGLRLIKLLDEATNVLRDYFLNCLQKLPYTLEDALQKQEKVLRKLLQNDQYDILFPKVGKTVPDEYDISLLTVVLRTIVKIVRPKTGWHNPPAPIDQSESAHIVRIQQARNKISHTRLSKNKAEFLLFLKTIGNSMVALGADIKMLNLILTQPIDGNVTALFNKQLHELNEENKRVRSLLDSLEEIQKCYDSNVWFGVLPLPSTFTGRKLEVEALHKTICSNRKLATVITGLSGTGKTSLALYYCYEYQSYYQNNVIWFNGNTYESLKDGFLKLSKHLKMIEQDENIENIVSRVYKFFSDRKVLFCFDNVDDNSVVLDFLPMNLAPSKNRPDILITSKVSKWGQRFEEHIIEMLSKDDSKTLIKNSLAVELVSSSESINEICDLIKGYVIALQQSISYMNYNMVSTEEYLQSIKSIKTDSEVLSFPAEDCFYQHDFYGLMIITLDTLKKQKNTTALDIIHLMSFMDCFSINKCFLLKSFERSELNSSLILLERLSLISVKQNYRVKETTITIHSLVQLMIRHQLHESNQHKEVIKGLFGMIDVLISERRDRIQHYDFGKHWIGHIIFLHKSLWDFDHVIAEFIYKRFGNIKVALLNVEMRKTVLSIMNSLELKIEDSNIIETATMLLEKIRFYVRTKEFSKGLQVCCELEELADNNNLQKKLYNTSLLFDKASCLSGTGQHEQALLLYRTIYQIETKMKENLSTLVVENNIAYELNQLGKCEEALSLIEETINKYKMTHGFENDRNFYLALDNKGKFLMKTGKYFEALSVFQELLSGDILKNRTEYFGNKSEMNHRAKVSLAYCHYSLGRYKETFVIADELYSNVKDDFEKFGYNRPVLLASMNYRGNSLLQLGRYKEAHEQYLEIKTYHAETSDQNLINELNIGITQQCMGLYKTALTTYQKVLDDYQHVDVNLHWKEDNLRVQIKQGGCLIEFGQYLDGLKLLESLKDNQILDENDHYTFKIHTSLAEGYYVLGRIPEAIDECMYVMKRSKNVCEWHMGNVTAKVFHKKCLLDTNEKPERVIDELIVLQENIFKELGDEHLFVVWVKSVIAEALVKAQKLNEARELLKNISNSLEKTLCADHPQALKTRSRLLLLTINNLQSSAGCTPEFLKNTSVIKDLQDIYNKQVDVLSKSHIDLLITKRGIAEILLLQNHYNAASQMLQDIQDSYENLLGKKHKEILNVKKLIALCARQTQNSTNKKSCIVS